MPHYKNDLNSHKYWLGSVGVKINNFSEIFRLSGYSLFIVTFSFFYYTQLAVITNLSSTANIFRGVTFFILFLGLFFRKYSIREIFLIVMLFLFSLYVSSQSKSIDTLVTLFLIVAMRQIEFRKIVRVDFYTRLISTIAIFILSSIRYIPTLDMYRGSTLRHSFGFYHPNLFGAYILILTLEFIYLGYLKNRNSYRVWVILPVVWFIGKATDDRSVEIALIIFFLLYFLLQIPYFKEAPSNFYKAITVVTFTSVSLISLFSSYEYNPTIGIWTIINKLLSGRPELINTIVKGFYPIRWFGQNTPLLGDSGVIVNGVTKFLYADNSYMSILIKFGICTFLVFTFWVLKNSFSFLEGKNKLIMFCWLIAMLAWGLSENKLILVQFNILLFSYFEGNKEELKCKNI